MGVMAVGWMMAWPGKGDQGGTERGRRRRRRRRTQGKEFVIKRQRLLMVPSREASQFTGIRSRNFKGPLKAKRPA